MSGVQTSLSLQDKLTGPLMKMMKAMDNTIKVMEKMDSSAKNVDMKGMEQARRAIDNASADMARLSSAAGSAGDSAGKAAGQQSKFNNAISGGLPGVAKLATGLLAAVGAYKAFGAAKSFIGDILKQGFDFQVLKQQSSAAFTVFLGDAEKAKQYMDDMYQFALTTPFAYPDLLTSSRNLMAFGIEAKNTIPIMQSIGDTVAAMGGGNAEMSSMSDIFGIIQSQGRITAMEVNRLASHGVNAYEMLATSAGVSAGEMKKQISDGAISSGQAITALVEGMNDKFGGSMAGLKGTILGTIDTFKSSMRNAGDKMIQDFIEPITRGIGNLTGLVKKIPVYLAPALAAFLPLIEMINSAFETGKFEPFFAFMGVSIGMVAGLFSFVAQGALTLFSVINDYWPVMIAGLAVILSFYLPGMLVALWGMVDALIVQLAVWALIYWPVTLVIGVVVALIAILMHFGVTSEQILGFVSGLFFALGAVVWNIVANMWNAFAIFAEFLINLFIDPTYAVQKLFYDLTKHVIDNMAAMAGSFDAAANALGNAFVSGANMAIGGVNALIRTLKKIPGVEVGEIGKLASSSSTAFSGGLVKAANNLKAPTSSKGVVSIGRMDLKSVPGAAKSGYKKGAGLKMPNLGAMGAGGMPPNTGLGDLMGGLGADGKGGKLPKGLGKGKNPTGGKLDSIGKIDDKISIADEDLKMLKELADIRSIQNFQTLQPSFTFGDMTIREEADIPKLIKGIEVLLRNEMDRSTEGVYS